MRAMNELWRSRCGCVEVEGAVMGTLDILHFAWEKSG